MGDLLTVLMVWVEVTQAEGERSEGSPLSDTPTGDHEFFLGAALLLSGWNCLCLKIVPENCKPPEATGWEQGECVG